MWNGGVERWCGMVVLNGNFLIVIPLQVIHYTSLLCSGCGGGGVAGPKLGFEQRGG